MRTDYSVVVPCFNEEESIRGLIESLFAIEGDDRPTAVVVVNDGSTDGTAAALDQLSSRFATLRIVSNDQNLGYGASLKAGIHEVDSQWVAIIDADGTYQVEDLVRLMRHVDAARMVVGARSGKDARIPLVRRPAKWIISRLAQSMAGRRIPDLNSGLRVMHCETLRKYLHMLPDGFSFTTTITLIMLTNGLRVKYLPIDYCRRNGRSKIRPVRDTLNFIQLVCRTVTWFNPLRFFVPLSMSLFGLGFVVLFASLAFMEKAMDVTFAVLIMAGLTVLAVGMLADLIDKRLQ